MVFALARTLFACVLTVTVSTALAEDIAVDGAEARLEAADTAAYHFAIGYTGDLWRNAHGGLRTGGTYVEDLDVALSIDGTRAWNRPALSAFVHAIYTDSGRFSERYVGDSMTVSNIDAPPGARVHEAWVEWNGSSARSPSVRFGLYDLNTEFDSSEARSLFIHSTHGVGHELAQTGENGPSIFPVTSLAVRLAWRPANDWRFMAAVLDGVPGDRRDPQRTGIHLSEEEGALAIAESQVSHGRVNKLSLGYWRYTGAFADVRSAESAPLPARHDNAGWYAQMEIALGNVRGDDLSSAAAFVRYGTANGCINKFSEFLGLGVRYQGLFAARSEDEVGLAFAYAGVSDAVRAAAAAIGRPWDGYETAIELTYRVVVNKWLTLQPNIQYILNPGADPALSDSFALGLRLELSMAALL